MLKVLEGAIKVMVCRAISCDREAKGIANAQKFFEAAGVGLSDGKDFGLPGFVRLNFGCPRATLDEALKRMAAAL